ncbi:MAG: HlyC/CorC family transporter [Alphaproteobacteria bacterium]|jgi:Mg2+/Co2+ transporter CorB
MIITILIILFLAALSAFFSAAEVSLIGSSNAKLHKYKMEGNKRADLVLSMRSKKDELIGAVLIGNNVANIIAASVATGAFIKIYGENGIVYASFVMSVVILLFGEVLPKSFSFKKPEKVALFVAPLMFFLIKIFYPINIFLEKTINAFDKLIDRLFGATHQNPNEGKEVIRGTIAEHYNQDVDQNEDKYMLSGILDLSELTVYDVMIHRSDVAFINADDDIDKIIEAVLNSKFSRFPVYEGKEEQIIGILHIKTLLREFAKFKKQSAKKTFNLKKILLEAQFVPDSRNLKNQLQDFRNKKNHLAIVVDEYGALEGIITLEDILEEIVGQIDDEHDFGKKKIKRIRTNYYEIEGDISVRDINRQLNWDLPEDEFSSTIAGFIINQARVIPEKGQIFNFFNIQFEIIEKTNQQITIIRAKKL